MTRAHWPIVNKDHHSRTVLWLVALLALVLGLLLCARSTGALFPLVLSL